MSRATYKRFPARPGYNALVFDGPGQQSMLFERQVPFRPDWGHVITPIVDFLLQRPEVNANGLALYGISQAGYWVPRALAFEHRIAAAVADPGVDDVASSWRLHLPQELLALLDGGDEKNFNAFMDIGMQSATPRSLLEQRMFDWLDETLCITPSRPGRTSPGGNARPPA